MQKYVQETIKKPSKSELEYFERHRVSPVDYVDHI